MNEKETCKTTVKQIAPSVDVCILDLTKTAASSVGRIISKNAMFVGTGFIISNRLFLTNNHVIIDSEQALNSLLELGFELSPDGAPKPVTAFNFAPNDFFMSSPREDLDFTIVAIGTRVSGCSRLSEFGKIPLTNNGCNEQLGSFVNIIHHTIGKYKQIILGAKLAAYSSEALHYYANTRSGSSGAPVLNERAKLIGVHHYRRPTRPSVTPDGKPGPRDANEGIRASAIIRRINSERNKLNRKQRLLIDKALSNC